MDLTPEQVASVDPCYWAMLKKIMLQSGQWSLKNHEYQKDIMQSRAKIEVTMKATQLGCTECEVLKSLHGMIYGRLPQGVLYLFPTADIVNEFSKSRFAPLISANKEAIGKYVKPCGKGTDTASLKKINTAFLYLRGARLSQKVGDTDESPQLRGIPVDRVVYDEWDLMDDDVRAKAVGRMGHSLIQEESFLSNPTIPGIGIDFMYQQSDQRRWFRKCTCGEFTCSELEFPNCVKTDDNGRGYIACKKCGKPVGIAPGEWVPAFKDRPIVGRQLSQLTSIFHDPYQILCDFNEPPNGNLGDVYRLKLGLPFIATEDKLRETDIHACCGQDIMQTSHRGPCAMGVDVGKIKHVVIGIRTGNDRFGILKVARVSSFNDIHDLAQRFNVKNAVIDIRPYEDEARQFQKAEGYNIYLCEYAENTIQGNLYNDHTGTVKSNRTEIFDSTHRLVVKKQMVIPRRCPEVDEFARQMCNTAKVLETNKKTNTAIYRYKKLGDEHYRNALNYFYLAAAGGQIAEVNSYKRTESVSDYNPLEFGL